MAKSGHLCNKLLIPRNHAPRLLSPMCALQDVVLYPCPWLPLRRTLISQHQTPLRSGAPQRRKWWALLTGRLRAHSANVRMARTRWAGFSSRIFAWDKSRWDTSVKVLLGRALLFPDVAVSTLASKFPQLEATIRANTDAWNLSVSIAAVGAALIMSGERANLHEYRQFSDAVLKVVQAFGGGHVLGEFLGQVKHNVAAGMEWPQAVGAWVMRTVKGDALTDQERASSQGNSVAS